MPNLYPDYRNYDIQQLLEDPSFQDWVFRPDFHSEKFWSEWMDENPGQIPLIEEARVLLLSLKTTEVELSNEEVEGLWETIQTEINSEKPKWAIFGMGSMRWRNWAAAGAAAILIFGLWWGLQNPDQLEFSTDFGETLSLTLPDGSKVILNSNSTLSFPEDWENLKTREVLLKGEAFFEVVHQKSHQPFLVNTPSGMEVEVLGTSFSVYNRAQKSQVVLKEGKVSLALPVETHSPDRILMEPGDLVSVKESKVEKKRVKAENYTSWTHNLLILDQTSLEEIIRVARENFGLTIEVDPEVSLSQTASGSMPLENPEHFMNLTAKIFSITIENKDSKYLINP